MTSSISPMGRVVFSVERARLLQQVLYVSVVVDLYFVAVTAIEVGRGTVGHAVSIGVPTVTLIGYTIGSLLMLRRRNQLARVLCAMTGSLLFVVGAILVQTLFALVPVVLGVLVFVLSFRRDDGER
jgi:glucose uptake protein GlcU